MEDIQEIKPEDINKEIKEVKEELKEEKKISDWILIIAIIAIIVILALVIAFKQFNKEQPKTIEDLHLSNLKKELKSDQGYVYRGYSFVFANGLWYTQVQNRAGTSLFNIPLHYSPRDVANVPIEGNFNSTIFNSVGMIYITFDPLGSNLQYVALAVGEFDQSIIKAFNKMPIAACDKNETKACETRPIITCNNTGMPVLYIQQKPETKVIYNNNCIIVQGEGPEIVRAVDRLLLNLYGIMV